MLVKLGPERVKLILDVMAEHRGAGYLMGVYHLREAVLKLVNMEHKELVLKLLPQHTFLATAVLDYGWEQDAKKVLIAELASAAPRQLPIEWIRAVANLKDPKTYENLKWYLIQQDGRYSTYEAIRDLPGLDLTDTVAKIWGETGYHEWEARGVAKIAVEYGHLDAVEQLVGYLGSETRNQWEVSAIRRLLLRHLDFYGSTREIAEWLRKNRDKITFDREKKKYVLGKQDG
jgi:hypothetical protein